MPLACSRASRSLSTRPARRAAAAKWSASAGRVERRARTGAPGAPAVAAPHEVRARESQPRALQRHLAPLSTPTCVAVSVDGGVDRPCHARGGRASLAPVTLGSHVDRVAEQRV